MVFWLLGAREPAWADQARKVVGHYAASSPAALRLPESCRVEPGGSGERILLRWPLDRAGLRAALALAARLRRPEVIAVVDSARAAAEAQAALPLLAVVPVALQEWEAAALPDGAARLPVPLRPQSLEARFAEGERDRLARLELIQRQGAEEGRLRGEIGRWIDDLEQVSVAACASAAEAAELRACCHDLAAHLASSQSDRAARLEVIEAQGRELGQVVAERNLAKAELGQLHQHVAIIEDDRAARLRVIEDQGRLLGEVTAERNLAQAALEQLHQHLARIEDDRAARLAVIEDQGRRLDAALRELAVLRAG